MHKTPLNHYCGTPIQSVSIKTNDAIYYSRLKAIGQLFNPFLLIMLLLLWQCATGYTMDSTAIEKQADIYINQLYHTLNAEPMTSMTQRIDWISQQFLGKPYVLGALGEGSKARFDQYPRYRTDGFDCETYVTTVLSLAITTSLEGFKGCLQHTRYEQGKVSYIYRNHFTELDWNNNNQKRTVLKDFTQEIKDQHHRAVALIAKAIIDKPNWYAHHDLGTIRLQHPTQSKQHIRLQELIKLGAHLPISSSEIPYLPLTALFDSNGEPNQYLFSQIPNGAIVEIVRPNWDLRASIGTALNVSHLGFAIWKNKVLYFREASSEYGRVVDVSLIDYLKKTLPSPTIKGINIQILIPETPFLHCS